MKYLYVKVTPPSGESYVIDFQDFHILQGEIREAMVQEGEGSWVIEIVEMTEEEFDALEEFTEP